jgi:hypothetical protein
LRLMARLAECPKAKGDLSQAWFHNAKMSSK